jgi:N-acetylmuramoyl-L-alanine amidase
VLFLVALVAACSSGPFHRATALPAGKTGRVPTTETTAAPATTVPTTTTVATTVAPVPTTPATPVGTLAGRVVLIDPGHNGGNGANESAINQMVAAGPFRKPCDTTGTQTDAGYTESAFNFDVAVRLTPILEAAGIRVVLTRVSDSGVGPCVNQRAAIGNRAHADVAVSIHADGGPAGGRGFHVIQPALVSGYTDGIVARSHQMALDLRGRYLSGTGMPYSTYAGASGLDTRGDLGGLNLSQVPKVFIECGNMRNATDASLLISAGFRQKAAASVALAIEDFLAGRPAH